MVLSRLVGMTRATLLLVTLMQLAMVSSAEASRPATTAERIVFAEAIGQREDCLAAALITTVGDAWAISSIDSTTVDCQYYEGIILFYRDRQGWYQEDLLDTDASVRCPVPDVPESVEIDLGVCPKSSTTIEPSPFRLDGHYAVRYSRWNPAFYPRGTSWAMTPRCRQGPCSTRVKFNGGGWNVLKFRESSTTYVLRARTAGYGWCKGTYFGSPFRVEPAYVLNRTIRLNRFAGLEDGVARFARGSVYDFFRPTRRARHFGCDPIERFAQIRVRRRR